jgi:uncharacterized protein
MSAKQTALVTGVSGAGFFDRAGMADTKVATGHEDDPSDVAADGFEALMAEPGSGT